MEIIHSIDEKCGIGVFQIRPHESLNQIHLIILLHYVNETCAMLDYIGKIYLKIFLEYSL